MAITQVEWKPAASQGCGGHVFFSTTLRYEMTCDFFSPKSTEMDASVQDFTVPSIH